MGANDSCNLSARRSSGFKKNSVTIESKANFWTSQEKANGMKIN